MPPDRIDDNNRPETAAPDNPLTAIPTGIGDVRGAIPDVLDGNVLLSLHLHLPPEVLEKLVLALGQESPADYPPGVDPHLASHLELLDRVFPEPSELKTVLQVFIKHHDLAYSDTELNLQDKETQEHLRRMFYDNAIIAGYTGIAAEAKAGEAYDFITRPENQHYVARKILLHGTGSIIAGTRRLEAAGLSAQQAQGFSYIFAAHHPGYPIDMVRNFVTGGDVPPDLCPILFICSKEAARLATLRKKRNIEKAVLTPAEEEELAVLQGKEGTPEFDGSANQLRKRIIDFGAAQAGIPAKQAGVMGLLGYALDRITPARRMRNFQMDTEGVVIVEKGNLQTSGETQKKYPLIVRDIRELADATTENCFGKTLGNVRKESEAFVAAFREVDPTLEPVVVALQDIAKEIIAETEDIQKKAITFGKTVTGVTGHLTNMIQDLACLRSRYREMDADDPDRDACQYHIAALQSIQSNPAAQQKLRELRESVTMPGGATPEDIHENALIHDLATKARTLRPGSRRGTMIRCVVDYASAHPEFAERLQQRTLKEGEVILGQGQENHTVFLLLSGTGKPAVYKEVRTKEGQMQRRLIDRMAFPNVAGELSLLNDNTATADVVMEGGDAEAITMTSNDFHQLMSTEGFEEAFQSLARQRLLTYVTKTEVLSPAQGAEELASVLREDGGNLDDHKKDILEGFMTYANAHPDAENLFLRKQFNRDSRIITQSPEHRGTATAKEKSGEHSVFIVLKGRAGIYRRSESGDPIFLGIIGPGTTVGEMFHFSEDQRRNATVTAEEDGTEVLEVREEQFQAMLRENVPLAVRLEQLAKRRESQKGLKIITGSDVADNWRTKFSPDVLSDPQKRDAVIGEVNDLYPIGVPNFRECRFTIVGRSEDGIVTIDSAGRVYFEEITRENAREVLARYKVSPTQKIETAGEEDASKNRYELLRECMWRNPDIHTIDAYTYNTLPQGKDDKKAEIADIDKWIPERHAVRENIVETWRAKIVEGHEKMKRAIAEKEGLADLRGKKVLVLLSGNTASGKSYTVENPPAACERIGLLNIDPACAINPDEMKAAIRAEELVNGVPQITSIQSHTEGAQMAEELIRWALGKEMHIAIDKRFTKPDDVREVTSQAQGYHTIMIDVDAELQTSLDRVYGNANKGIKGRNPNGTSPIPPRNVIEGGYMESVSHRREKANLVHEINGEYWLLKSDIPREKKAVLLAHQKADDPEPTLNTDYPMLVMHAMQAPEGMLFSRKCLANINGMSRTIGSGTVDTSATAKKAASMAKIDGSVGDFARLNFQCVVERVHAERNRAFESPQDVRVFIETIATEINRGIVKEGILYRTANSTKFPYTAIAKLPDAMNQFCEEFHRRLSDGDQDPVALAAWVEYKIDLTDHFFEDGCGKVAKVLSAWVLARASAPLPAYRGREEYYGFVKDQDMLNEKAWEAYYRTFFPHKGGVPDRWEGKKKDLATLIQQKHTGMRSGGRPDWQHCIDVTCDLEAALSLDRDVPDAEKETILLAALGHDLYEDTDVDHEEIQQKFGADTDRKIAALTNPTGDTSVTAYLAQIDAADEGVKIIKLGDMLDNYRSVLQDTKQPPAKRQLPKEWFLQFFLPIIEPMFEQMQQETFTQFSKASRFLLLQIQSYRSELLKQFPEFSLPPTS